MELSDTDTAVRSDISATIDLRTLSAISKFCGVVSGSLAMLCVLLQIDEQGTTYVAMNGHAMAARRVNLRPGELRNTFTGRWLIPAEACGFKVLSGDNPYADVSQHDGGLRIVDARGRKFYIEPDTGTYPDWVQVVPRSTDGVPKRDERINPAYLVAVEQFAKRLGLGRVTACWNSESRTVPFVFSEDANAFCLIAAMRQDVVEWSVPEWVR